MIVLIFGEEWRGNCDLKNGFFIEHFIYEYISFGVGELNKDRRFMFS